jgi:CubicO group peptidase (beta-lactamase class C family)
MRSTFQLATVALAVVAGASLPLAQPQWPTAAWPESSPRAEGIDPAVLERFDKDLASGKYGFIDSVLVIRHGKVAFERRYAHDYGAIYREEARVPGPLNAHDPSGPYNYYNPWWHPYYQRGDLHTLQSVTKTITSVVIGAAIQRKEFPSIDTPLLSFFDVSKVANVDDRKRRITLKHVLTMTTGLDWNEDVPYADPTNASSLMEASFDWVQFTIDRPMAVEPGTTFQYSSGATQLLSHVFRKATGQDIEEYAVTHVFAPLGIRRHFWKRSPSGLADTEGGLFLTSRDIAKFAYLYLHKGQWGGRQIVPAEWVAASIAPAVTVSARGTGIQYGYKWWLYEHGPDKRVAFGGSGFGGQRPLVVPELDLIVVYTGWNIRPDGPVLSVKDAIDRIVEAVAKK